MNTPDTYNLTLVIPKLLFSSLLQKPADLLHLMQKEQIDALKAYLFDQLKDKDGSPEIDEIRIHTIKYNEESKAGSFRIHFMINRRFCCSDTEACRTDYVDVNFDYRNETLVGTAHYFNWELDN